MRRLLASTALIAALAGAAHAEVVRVVVESRTPLPGTFGAAGAYEVIRGQFFGELDPKDPKNAIIQDIALAPKNARGKVEYSATFAMSKPVDMSKASGFLFFDVPNRGTMRVEGDADGRIHLTSGWQADIPPAAGVQTVTAPVARNPDGASVVGPALARFVNMPAGSQSRPLRGGINEGVPRPLPASLDTHKATLIKRTTDTDPGTAVAPEDFAFADCTKAPFPGTPDPTQLCIRGGFDTKYAYDLVYQAKDPVVMGVGFAATRDIVSFFHHSPGTAEAANPIAGQVKWTIATGVSQAGNYLRGLLNAGFNQDEAGRIVFDGMNPIIAGRQVALNVRFSMPGGASYLYDAGNEGAIWWTRYDDKVRKLGVHSLLDRCTATNTCPKVFDTFGATEFWALRMSPDLVGTDGKADIPLPANVRRYYSPSVTHGGGPGGFPVATLPPPATCALPANPNPSSDTLKALTKHLEAWVAKGTEPPASVYPTLAHGDLVAPTAAATGFPTIPGHPTAGAALNPFLIYDFGPQYNRVDISGVMTKLPPGIDRTSVPLLVPRVNSDGNETSGIPSVQLQVPLGTYLGWNLYAGGYYAGQGCGYQGGFIPFATTKAERTASNDPRPSLEERYGDHAGFVTKVKAAAAAQVAKGYLLQADADRIVREADQSKVLVAMP